jgi:hypothetical protein
MKNISKIKPYMGLLLLLCNSLPLKCMHTENSQTEQVKLQKRLNRLLVTATLENNGTDMQAAIDQGADLEAINEVKNPSLIWAAKKNLTNTTKLLLYAGANANFQKSLLQNTPLIWAAQKKCLPNIRILITYGADFTILNQYNQTAKEVANNNNNHDCENYLIAVAAGFNNFLTDPVNFATEPINQSNEILTPELFWNHLYYGLTGTNRPNKNYFNHLSAVMHSYRKAHRYSELSDTFYTIAEQDPLEERRSRFALAKQQINQFSLLQKTT